MSTSYFMREREDDGIHKSAPEKNGGFTGTVERTAIDTALEEIIGDPKIPTPNYSSSLYSSVPDEELVYESNADEVEIERIESEREDRGLSPAITDSGTIVRTSEQDSEINQQMTLLNNEIYDLEGIIRARKRRGQDTSTQEAELASLVAQLERLRR